MPYVARGILHKDAKDSLRLRNLIGDRRGLPQPAISPVSGADRDDLSPSVTRNITTRASGTPINSSTGRRLAGYRSTPWR